jgi:hypothetical protein
VDLESRLRLEQDTPAVEEFLAETGGGLHHPDPGTGLYWAVIQPRSPDADPFVARLEWSVYPSRPPSLTFAHAVGAENGGRAAWPAASGYRAPNDVCKPFTAEGQTLHAEWTTGVHAWSDTGNPFLHVVQTIQGDIDRVNGKRAG